MRKIFTLLVLGTALAFAKPIVTASILPTKYFIEQIAGNTLEVNVMVGTGADPHTYEPKPKQMKDLEVSKLYFAVGIEFEDTWLERFSKAYKNLKIIKTDDGIEKIAMSDEHDHEHHDHKCDMHHDHDEEGHDHGHHHHHHGGLDPHIWLDPILVKTQVRNIANALIAEFPQNAKIYEQNLVKFNAKLDELDKFIADKLANVKSREFIVYHPSWGYFSKRYNLEQIAIEVEGKEPKPAQIAELIEEAKEHNVKVIFVAPQFSQKSAKLIAAQAGAKVSELDQLPLDWYNEMKKTAEILAQSL
ncbi:zinc ABC transporter substrate-binding protein [Campylobacter sp. faydin G-105]|uniref:metal ABC transporter solute-binding protein, Zn/Mn family n=1 Tax=Campylobacter anatolicus TaxID=2829105 RepID=UPI001BA342E8|nr:zinc ABC transporter substrate-binding protein [Campylobacter anatolicus]MBR8461312.1 zinc ABC transporter substrate-binding protein [Campylobacter anatolicus]